VLQALSILAGSPLPDDVREQVIADTLRGAPAARRAWIENGMTLDVASGQRPVTLPVQVVVGSLDRVEREAVLRETLPPLFPEATFRTLGGVGHLSPLEAPEEIARSCVDGVRAMLDTEGQTGPEAGRLPCCAGIG
jgi:pimeloyl-ACP methyl ester carboxylesterase